jgi:hypothetical protein
MSEKLSKTGRELNATFVPGSLIRKTDKKMSNTLISTCTPLSRSSSQDTNWKSQYRCHENNQSRTKTPAHRHHAT